MRNYLLFVLALLIACAPEAPNPEPEPTATVAPVPAREPMLANLEAMQAPSPAALPIEDPYPDAEKWCYEVDDLMPCRRVGDSDANPLLPTECDPDPRTGRKRHCIDPWWVPGHERLCVPKGLTRTERNHAVREIESFVYRRQNGRHKGICEPQGWWRWGQGHKVAQGYCNPDPLILLLRIVSWREARHDPRWTHLMDPDQKAALRSYQKKKKLYASNKHYYAWYRWRGRGAYGTNPATHLWRFDVNAPPEILCNRVIATEVYLETLRACHPKLTQLRGDLPDWWDLHHCASGGSFDRPEEIPTDQGSFHQRATKVGLDPYQKVPVEWLGDPIDHDMTAVRAIEAEIDAYIAG